MSNHSSRFLDDHAVEAALSALSIESAARSGAAKAEEIRASENLKIVFSRLRLEARAKTVAEREDAARTHPEYQAAVERLAEATERSHTLRDKTNKAEALLSFWQTENANARAAMRMK